MKEKSLAAAVGGCIGYIVAVFLIGAFNAWVLELLWNWIIPVVFHGPTITFWVAYAMVALLSLIGGFFKNASKEK